MSFIIDKLQAVITTDTPIPAAAANRRPLIVPTRLDPRTVVGLLSKLGLAVPTAVTAAVAKGNLRASGHRYTNKEIDAALSKANVGVSDRFRIKAAMTDNRIIEA
jgi:hypothetical protein